MPSQEDSNTLQSEYFDLQLQGPNSQQCKNETICYNCLIKFDNPYELSVHLNVCQNNISIDYKNHEIDFDIKTDEFGLFLCQFCSYKHLQKQSMIRHMKNHVVEKKYGCSLCPYRAKYKHHFEKHMKVHTGERDFACNLCSYRGSQKINLENHMKTHTGEKPFACQFCDYRTAWKGNLKGHMQKHLQNQNERL